MTKLRAVVPVLLLCAMLVGLMPMTMPAPVEAQGDDSIAPELLCQLMCQITQGGQACEEACTNNPNQFSTNMCGYINTLEACGFTSVSLTGTLSEECTEALFVVMFTALADENLIATCTISEPDPDAVFQCMRNYYGCNVSASGDPSCGFTDLRLDQYACAAPVAVYCDGSAADIYLINGSGSGEPLMTVDLPATTPAENTLLTEASGVSVYQLSTGEFQVNALDAEGNPYVLVWDACPANNIYQVK